MENPHDWSSYWKLHFFGGLKKYCHVWLLRGTSSTIIYELWRSKYFSHHCTFAPIWHDCTWLHLLLYPIWVFGGNPYQADGYCWPISHCGTTFPYISWNSLDMSEPKVGQQWAAHLCLQLRFDSITRPWSDPRIESRPSWRQKWVGGQC